MKVKVIDEAALTAVRPLELAGYLRANGWKEVDENTTSSVWLVTDPRTKSEFEVLLPLHQEWRDYAHRIADLLETLAKLEGRSQVSVLRDLTESGSDVVRVRASEQADLDGTIDFGSGRRLIEAAYQMVFSAACAAVEPKRAFHSRRPVLASAYMSGVRMGQSERGSYVVSVISRVPPALEANQGELPLPGVEPPSPPDDPFERKVTITLAHALEALHHAARRGAATGSLAAFEEAVQLGVSANLCEALAGVDPDKHVEKIDISVAWSPSRPVRQKVPTIATFSPDVLEVIGEAGRVLREKSTRDDFVLEGVVYSINRPGDLVSGKVVIFGFVDGEPRKVAVEVQGRDWNIATEAIKEHTRVRCEGELTREGRQFSLRNPRNLRSVSDE